MPMFVKKTPDVFIAERLPTQRVGQDLAEIIIPLAEIMEWCDANLERTSMGTWELIVLRENGDRQVAIPGMWVVKRSGDRYARVMRDEDFRGEFAPMPVPDFVLPTQLGWPSEAAGDTGYCSNPPRPLGDDGHA